jgi:hypothetical protein
MTNKSRAYSKPSKSEAVEARAAIKYGQAHIPYCEMSNCWMLPAGPAQKQRKLKTYSEAMRFAKLLNGLLAGVPMNHKH